MSILNLALHILGAAIANVLISFVWFHPRVFGTYWRTIVGISPRQAEVGMKRMPYYVLYALLGSLLLAYVLQAFGQAWGAITWWDALGLGFWSWLGFIVPTSLGIILWELKPVRFYLVTVGYWFVSFIIMALIVTI